MLRIAIIGGGAAGAAVIGEFLRRGSDVELVWLAGRNPPGRGVAYGTTHGAHLLNVRAANMGLFVDDVGGLVRFLQQRDATVDPAGFVSRAVFGDYIEHTLERLLADRATSVRVESVAAEAVAIEPLGDGTRYLVRTDDARIIPVHGIVLAIGALPPVPIAEVERGALDGGRYLPDPWQAPKHDQAPERVLVLGSGLTAVDVSLAAAAQWPGAKIVALSRHGVLPAAHPDVVAAAHGRPDDLIASLRAHPNTRAWLRRVRAAAFAAGADWRAVVDGLRPATLELWRSLPRDERKRFLRHVRWAWEAVRHRMPPQNARAIERLRAEGRLQILAGRVQRIAGQDTLSATWRRREDGRIGIIEADLVIQATGLQTAVRRTSHALLRDMFGKGLVRADALGLGIDADVHGRAIRADGSTAPGLRVIGTLLRGALWECTALPEIRMLAARLAQEMPVEIAQARERVRQQKQADVVRLRRAVRRAVEF